MTDPLPPRSTNRSRIVMAKAPLSSGERVPHAEARPCGDCARPLSVWNPNTLCAGCTSIRARLYGVRR